MELEIKGCGNGGLQGQQPSAQGVALGISNQRRAMAACKANKLLAQGNTLGHYEYGVNTPWKGKRFMDIIVLLAV